MALKTKELRRHRWVRAALVWAIVGFLTVVQTGQSWAQRGTLIRDAEIEATIRGLATPLLRASGLSADSVRIHLVRNNELNAFVAGGLQIFIYTGLLQRAETPNQVTGVLAHEIGHIEGGHLARSRDQLRGASAAAILSTILGVAAAVASGDPRIGAAVAAGGQEAAVRNFLQYNRAHESAADQAAARLLDATGQSAVGLTEFLDVLGNQEVLPPSQQDPYMRTHPFSRDRVAALRNHMNRSRYTGVKDSPEAMATHARMQAKLAGFLDPTSRVMANYPESDQSLPALYARAVAYHRLGNPVAADKELSKLLAQYPNDAYFHELDGQIRFERGDSAGSIAAYAKAVELSRRQPLIVMSYARAVVEAGNPAKVREVIPMLERALDFEYDSGGGWRLLGTAYGKVGERGEAALALAESEWRFGHPDLAALQAHRAQQEFRKGTPGWLRAEDLKLASERVMRTRAEQQR